MPLIDEYQVVALQGFHRHALAFAALLHDQLGDLDNAHRPHFMQQTTVFVEAKALRRNAGRLQFVQMLLAQSFVGCNQQNVVQ